MDKMCFNLENSTERPSAICMKKNIATEKKNRIAF